MFIKIFEHIIYSLLYNNFKSLLKIVKYTLNAVSHLNLN